MNLTNREVIYPRLALLCLGLVVILTLFLFGVGLVALRERQAEVMGLALSNVKLRGERIAAELNRQSWQQAEAALADPVLEQLLRVGGQPASAKKEQEILSLSNEVRQRHPIVKRIITLADGRVQMPARFERSFRQALEKRLAVTAVGRTGTEAIWLGSEQCQVFFKLLESGTKAAAFVVDDQWVSEVLLGRIALSLGFDQTTARHVRLKQGQIPRGDDGTGSLTTPVSGIFPSMYIEIAESPIQRQKARAVRETIYLVVSCLIFLTIVGAGLLLIIRVIRDLQVKQLRTDFMSAFSHELKTPLTLIRLYGEMLQEDNLEPDSRKSYCDIIGRQSDRLCKLLGRLLDAQRLEMGRKQFTMEEGDFAEMVAETVKDYAEHLHLRGFHLEIDLARRLPPLTFDKEAVSQSILNLMDNARKYSGENKYIGVRLWQESRNLIVEVEDQGIGIPTDQQKKIFESFYRVSAASIRQGFGLGLFLVNHVMRAHNGRVEVSSRVGIGSRFRLVFPLQPSSIWTILQEHLLALASLARLRTQGHGAQKFGEPRHEAPR